MADELRRLSQYCKYGDFLEKMLRDRLAEGINHDRTQQQLLSEGASLTLQKSVRYCPVGGICNSTSGSCRKQEPERDGHVNVLKVNKQKHIFMFLVYMETVPRYVHLSINNVFIVKTKDTLKMCVERKQLKKMFRDIRRILLLPCTN